MGKNTQPSYNGWPNWATWYVNHDVFGGVTWGDFYDVAPTVTQVKDLCDHFLFDNGYMEPRAKRLAKHALSTVDWNYLTELIRDEVSNQ